MKLEIIRQVHAPVDVTFDVFSDISRSQDRIDGVTAVEILSDVKQGAGTRWRETRVMFGREATEEMEISVFEPNQSYEVVSQSHGTAYHTRFTFAEQNGGTQVKMIFSAKPITFGARVASIFAFVAMGATRKAFESDMDDLKAAAEQQAAG